MAKRVKLFAPHLESEELAGLVREPGNTHEPSSKIIEHHHDA